MKEVKAKDGPVVKEWNVDDFHKCFTSLKDVYTKTLNCTPIFTIIQCDHYKSKNALLSRPRNREELVHLLNCIEVSGTTVFRMSYQ